MEPLGSETELALKLALSLPLLLRACLLDWRTREIDNASWLSLVLLGAVFLLIDVAGKGVAPLLMALLSVAVTSAFMLLLYRLRLLAEGDAKLLIGISVLFPYYHREVVTVFPVFALSVFANAIMLTLVLPLLFFIRNLPHVRRVRSAKELYALFLGYKRKASEIKPYEAVYGDGERFTLLLGTDAELGRAEGEGEVWVTPAVPFVIPITVSVLLSAYFGDIASLAVLLLRGS